MDWTRLTDALPDIGEPILVARWDAEIDDWRVRDARMLVRHEGVVPLVSDLAGGLQDRWWFEAVYGRGDTRLATPDLLWARMPKPPRPA